MVRLIPLTAVVLLAGCASANWNTAYREFDSNKPASISIDAKQRVVFSVDKNPDRDDAKRWIAVCAEPAPDALSALSASLGVDASVAGKALGIASSSQEGAASIGLRTQTIQTLRDAMYRLCEGYAAGALDDVGFARLQRRYQAIMLGLLAIEQLTGPIVASQAVLGGSASTRMGQSLAQVTTLLSDTRGKAVAAQVDLKAKTTAVDAAQKAVTDAEGVLKKATGEAAQEAAKADLKTKSDTLVAAEAAKQKAAQADAVLAAEVASLEALRRDLDRGVVVASVSGALTPAPTRSAPDSAAFMKAAETIDKIVTRIVDHDYTKETCMDTITSRRAREMSKPEDVDLLRLQMYYCALNFNERAVYATYGAQDSASGRWSLNAEGRTAMDASLKSFTEQMDSLLKERRADLKQHQAERDKTPPNAPAPKKP